jgi:hypothetical protein
MDDDGELENRVEMESYILPTACANITDSNIASSADD